MIFVCNLLAFIFRGTITHTKGAQSRYMFRKSIVVLVSGWGFVLRRLDCLDGMYVFRMGQSLLESKF
jgi:hypothetical protein